MPTRILQTNIHMAGAKQMCMSHHQKELGFPLHRALHLSRRDSTSNNSKLHTTTCSRHHHFHPPQDPTLDHQNHYLTHTQLAVSLHVAHRLLLPGCSRQTPQLERAHSVHRHRCKTSPTSHIRPRDQNPQYRVVQIKMLQALEGLITDNRSPSICPTCIS